MTIRSGSLRIASFHSSGPGRGTVVKCDVDDGPEDAGEERYAGKIWVTVCCPVGMFMGFGVCGGHVESLVARSAWRRERRRVDKASTPGVIDIRDRAMCHGRVRRRLAVVGLSPSARQSSWRRIGRMSPGACSSVLGNRMIKGAGVGER